MKVDYAKEFEKSLKKLSGKMLDSIWLLCSPRMMMTASRTYIFASS